MRPTATVMILAIMLAGSACAPRVVIVTGTTLGMKATPGDGSSQPPQVTLGYKRAEASIVPTKGSVADSNGTDAFSTMAAFDYRTRWFGETELASFIGTGFAARDIQGTVTQPNGAFAEAFHQATLLEVSNPIHDRQVTLRQRAETLDDATKSTILKRIHRRIAKGNTPTWELKEAILDANTEASLSELEDAFDTATH